MKNSERPFVAKEITEIASNEAKTLSRFTFVDENGDTLRLVLNDEIAGELVSRCQATFVAKRTQAVAGRASEDIAQGRFMALSLRHLQSADAQPALVRHPPVVHLQLDRSHQDELNYSLEPDDADRLAERLKSASTLVRQERNGQGQ